ncbi:hypothetical protein N8459_02960 [Nitrosopumilus sp.]|nr:hypothetical protein [Nitrosopumilus sp.]
MSSFCQYKLTRKEWEGLEYPIAPAEKKVCSMIINGYNDPTICIYPYESILQYLKINVNEMAPTKVTAFHQYIYKTYMESLISSIHDKYLNSPNKTDKTDKNSNYTQHKNEYKFNYKPPKHLFTSSDKIRFSKNTAEELQKQTIIFEYQLLQLYRKFCKYIGLKNAKWQLYYYAINKMTQLHIPLQNAQLLENIKNTLKLYENKVQFDYLLLNGCAMIESRQLDNIIFYTKSLYSHQSQIFNEFRRNNILNNDDNNVVKTQENNKKPPTLLLYIAPTGTGKTLTPIGLCAQYNVIFVCAARHVGLSLASTALSMNVKIGIGFGCNSLTDIRLHNNSMDTKSANIIRDYKSGGIRKGDHMAGDKVQMMICDVHSYIHAMNYMKQFETQDKPLLTFWDEPTIGLDVLEHDIHSLISANWKENIVEYMVLSSATLPKIDSLTPTIESFKRKFGESTVISQIVTNDCSKSIPIIDNNGYMIMPHTLTNDFEKLREIITHCQEYTTLLRYFDLTEACAFIQYVLRHIKSDVNLLYALFDNDIVNINSENIKKVYLRLIHELDLKEWTLVYEYFKGKQMRKLLPNKKNKIVAEPWNGLCGVHITTEDAYTLTGGPTIFIANDVISMANFYLKDSNIHSSEMARITNIIKKNSELSREIEKNEKRLEDIQNKNVLSTADPYKMKSSASANSKAALVDNKEIRELQKNITNLQSMIKLVSLDEVYLPNTKNHLNKWAPKNYQDLTEKFGIPFAPIIDPEIVLEIMENSKVADPWKFLLLMGIGVFSKETTEQDIHYVEIMKSLASSQKLFLIIADSNYLYGTNYQLFHLYLSKNMNLTQEKLIQSFGRVGRQGFNQQYSIRIREREIIDVLFTTETDKIEANNMNRLLGD